VGSSLAGADSQPNAADGWRSGILERALGAKNVNDHERTARLHPAQPVLFVVVSAGFEGKSLLDRHRQINAVLKDELAGPVHALAIKALTPAEAAR